MFASVQTMAARKLSCPHDNARFTEREAARLCVQCGEPYLPRSCRIVRCSNCGAESMDGVRSCLCVNPRSQVSGYRCPSCLHESGSEMLDAPLACPYCFTAIESAEAAPPKPVPRKLVPAIVSVPKAAPPQEAAPKISAPQAVPPQEPALQAAALKVPEPTGPSLRASSQPSARNFKRFIPIAGIFLCAAVAVAAAYQYGPGVVEQVLKSLRSSPKLATPNNPPPGPESRPVAQKPHPGIPAQAAPAPQAGEAPAQSAPTAQTQPFEPAGPAVGPAQSPAGGNSPRPAPSQQPSIAGSQASQPPQPANPAAVVKPPVIVSFTTSSQSIERGASATLHWNVTGDNPTVTLLPGIGAVPAAGSWEVKPVTTQQFTLTATNNDQPIPQMRSIVIVVVPPQTPRIDSFTADASEVRLGQTLLLRWTVSGASAVRIDPGIGPVNSSGALVVRPLRDTAYTLSASGPGGATKGTVPISVLAAAPAPAGLASYPTPSPASPSPTPFSRLQKDPGALRLLALVQTAVGGKSNLEAIHDWQRMERVSWDVNGGTTFENTTFVAPATIRVESQGGSTTVDFSDGESGWTWSSTRPTRNSLPSSTATSMPFRSLPELLLSDDDPQRSVTLAGPSTLLIADSHNDRVWLRIDPFTHLPRSIAWINVDGSELEESYSDWRLNAGVMWWFHMTRSRNGQEFLRADAIGVRVNQGWSAQRMASR